MIPRGNRGKTIGSAKDSKKMPELMGKLSERSVLGVERVRDPGDGKANPGEDELGLERSRRQGVWYLGIDIGTTRVSAALFDRVTCQLYPIFWSDRAPGGYEEGSFALSSAVYLSAQGVWLRGFKPLLCGGIAGTKGVGDRGGGEGGPDAGSGPGEHPPLGRSLVQWSEGQTLPLSGVLQGLQALLATLTRSAVAGEGLTLPPSGGVVVGAAGLEGETFRAAIASLHGAIVSQPQNWPDSYRFNLREAIVGAKLVADPSQIVFADNAIAAWLSVQPGAQGEVATIPSALSARVHPHWGNDRGREARFRHGRGCAMAIDAGAMTTEVALVRMPGSLSGLQYADFKQCSFPYAGIALDQDIICQLFWNRQVRGEKRGFWGLGCDLPLPRAGNPDVERRSRLQQRLLDSPEGRALLEAAEWVKLSLQQQDEVSLELGGARWAIARGDLDRWVFEPFIGYLNEQLNQLLCETGISVVGIQQVICTGGTMRDKATLRWLRYKLPNARTISDPVVGDAKAGVSRVAYGLASLPLNPQVIDLHQQQYGDYFLLAELLQILGGSWRSFAEILQLLERRGIHTRSQHHRIKGLLEGNLPPGLTATFSSLPLPEMTAYPLDSHLPLFDKQQAHRYRLNPLQSHRLHHFFTRLTLRTHQSLKEPLPFLFGVSQLSHSPEFSLPATTVTVG